MTTHIIPLSYKPKIEAVKNGKCTQTIRKVKKREYNVGDKIIIHGWEGRPKYSKWGWRVNGVLTSVTYVKISEDGLRFPNGDVVAYYSWDSEVAKELAERDFIDPPTGRALKEVLKELNGWNWEGFYHILRWRPSKRVVAEGIEVIE